MFCFFLLKSLSRQGVPFLFLAKLWKVGPANLVHSYPIWKLLVLLSLDCRKGRWNQSGRPQSPQQAGARTTPWTRERGATWKGGILNHLCVDADQVFWDSLLGRLQAELVFELGLEGETARVSSRWETQRSEDAAGGTVQRWGGPWTLSLVACRRSARLYSRWRV